VTPATEEAVRALALLPMSILGYGPVKEAAEAKAAKQRESLLQLIRAGGAPLKAAAE
jgi:indolepyruvate ferredoxin oxidoreductase